MTTTLFKMKSPLIPGTPPSISCTTNSSSLPVNFELFSAFNTISYKKKTTAVYTLCVAAPFLFRQAPGAVLPGAHGRGVVAARRCPLPGAGLPGAGTGT